MNQKNTFIPSSWEQPLYKLGQRVEQGEIIGILYYPEGTILAREYGSGWRYDLLSSGIHENLQQLDESSIKPLSHLEIQAVITEEIEFHNARIASLTEQGQANEF